MKKLILPLAVLFGLGVIAPAFADTSTPPAKTETEKKAEKKKAEEKKAQEKKKEEKTGPSSTQTQEPK
jgi:ribosomal protein L12E/L44/L45/RPP1/RPP2